MVQMLLEEIKEPTRATAPLSPFVAVVDLLVGLLGFVWLNFSHYRTFSRGSGLHAQSFRFHQFRNCGDSQ